SISLDATIAPYTTDGDLALDPGLLGDEPALEAAMRAAGFDLKRNPEGHIEPGTWITQTSIGHVTYDVPVDLIVPDAVAGAGRRGARLPAHGNQAARRAVGLEAALIDHAPATISPLDPDDDRSVVAEVAGIAALFVAKAHKLHDRIQSAPGDRLSDKDASDVIRLMQSSDPDAVRSTMHRLADDETAGPVTGAALDYLQELFGRRNGQGVQLAVRAMQAAIPSVRIEAIAVAYIMALL
ncbi:MAG TPA: hypothetical protein VHC23_05105, partial [Jatrophihabitans sp.]|nr:hypothetical protein [Jatrophihabitans sp.]